MENETEETAKPPVGEMPRGQAWVELHGTFSAEKLRDIAKQIDKNMNGMEKKDVRS
jgi:hypothetical protein